MTEIGFLVLNQLFIERARTETPWIVLRRHGYNNDLMLRDDFLHPPFEVGSDASVELTSDGYTFLAELFKAHDKDKDGALSPAELTELYSTSPGDPWHGAAGDSCATNDRGWITLQGFLAHWSMTTLLDPRLTLEYLAYLGYSGSTMTAVKSTRPRHTDQLRGRLSRNVLRAMVFGAKGSGKVCVRVGQRRPLLAGRGPADGRLSRWRACAGVRARDAKTALLRGLVGKRHVVGDGAAEAPQPETEAAMRFAVNGVTVNGQEKYLTVRMPGALPVAMLRLASFPLLHPSASALGVPETGGAACRAAGQMQEIPANGHDMEVIASRKHMDACDVACFVYDVADANSFAYVARLHKRLADTQVPCVFIAAKSDLPAVAQDYELQPAGYCSTHHLPPPIPWSERRDESSSHGAAVDLHTQLARIALVLYVAAHAYAPLPVRPGC